MKKLYWVLISVPTLLLVVGVSVAGYQVHKLSFNQRLLCAIEADYAFYFHPICQSYISLFYNEDNGQTRDLLSASLGFLMTSYEVDKGTATGDRALALADQFIKQGADVNFVNHKGATPLHEAVSLGEPELVQFLLVRGADPDKRTHLTDIGEIVSPLEFAVLIGERGALFHGEAAWVRLRSLLETYSQQADPPQSAVTNNTFSGG